MPLLEKYRKFKISLKPESWKGQADKDSEGDSKGKTQGLKPGDIVRRQYFDGKNIIYTLMCVLESGVDDVQIEEAVLDANGNYILLSNDPIEYKTQTVTKQQPWFIGLLLDGSAPLPSEVLDFVRITNLFDEARSGALYLTASDDESPYMDVIDGIGRNCSLTWPENLNDTEFDDPQSQYIVSSNQCDVAYHKELIEYNDDDNKTVKSIRNRVLSIKKLIGGSASIQQAFTQYVKENNEVVISFWAKASTPRKVRLSLGYLGDVSNHSDGTIDIQLTTEWKYYVYPIIVGLSGRHRRAIEFNLSAIQANEEFYLADFNAILLSSLANFGDASQIRVGKLSGISDPVFGKLDSYGGYFQKLFATTSAHISGTLTAGDENGFAATFYAGKIHKNAFYNSLEPAADIAPFQGSDLLDKYGLQNPTGIGNVFEVSKSITMAAQSRDSWLLESGHNRIGETYTFSFWSYCMGSCQLAVLQNAKLIGTIQVPHSETMGWHRQKITFQLFDTGDDKDVVLSIIPTYQLVGDDSGEKRIFLFTSPQLESGRDATQYQPTDKIILQNSEDYGAWFNRGGIGGTIQNPLLQLNADGEGAIETRSHSLRINQDGSGYLANKGIEWDEQGNVVFGPNVHLNWSNLGADTQHNLENKSIRLTGGDTFAVMGSTDAGLLYSPDFVKLTLEETGMNQVAAGRKWYYQKNGQYIQIESHLNDSKTQLTLYPDDPYWGERESALIIRVVDTYQDKEYIDAVTVRKYLMDGYTVEISSSKGNTFRNGEIETILTAQVYYQGEPVDEDFITDHFTYLWHKYQLPDLENEVENWWLYETVSETGKPHTNSIDRESKTLDVTGSITGSEAFVCEIITKNSDSFPYDFPILF